MPPTNINCSWTGSGFLIEWTASISPNVTYTIRRRETGQSTGSDKASDIASTSYTDATASSGRYYYYSVKAVSGGTNSSEYSDEYKCFTTFTYNEVERNGPTSSLTTLDWSSYMDENTADKELLIINGGYSGTYAGYNAASYKYYDWDLFELTFDNNDVVKIEVLEGSTSGLLGMDLRLTMIVSSGGGESVLGAGNPVISGSIFTWNISYSAAYNLKRAYLMVSMPDDLINTGPYNYQLRITITRE